MPLAAALLAHAQGHPYDYQRYYTSRGKHNKSLKVFKYVFFCLFVINDLIKILVTWVLKVFKLLTWQCLTNKSWNSSQIQVPQSLGYSKLDFIFFSNVVIFIQALDTTQPMFVGAYIVQSLLFREVPSGVLGRVTISQFGSIIDWKRRMMLFEQLKTDNHIQYRIRNTSLITVNVTWRMKKR